MWNRMNQGQTNDTIHSQPSNTNKCLYLGWRGLDFDFFRVTVHITHYTYVDGFNSIWLKAKKANQISFYFSVCFSSAVCCVCVTVSVSARVYVFLCLYCGFSFRERFHLFMPDQRLNLSFCVPNRYTNPTTITRDIYKIEIRDLRPIVEKICRNQEL